jgi:hypothetical protein
LQKLNHFSFGNNVLGATAPNRDGCLWRDKSVPSNQLNRPILNKMTFYPPGKHDFQEVFLSKTKMIPKGKQCA